MRVMRCGDSVVFALRWGGLDTFPGPARQARHTSNPARAGRQGATARPRLRYQRDPPRSPRSGGGQPRSQLLRTARTRQCDTSAPPAHPARAQPGRSAARQANLPGAVPGTAVHTRGPHGSAASDKAHASASADLHQALPPQIQRSSGTFTAGSWAHTRIGSRF
ncbi:hypothetical protein NDU88_005898 [Pleurodeles waltl]|uniref:Uncharacterized protein n=1 Tax=Pleurodeles waltl TaxID=8319 RepID=A0AAV7LVC8_PLEWA|nr:hypothetical protein NDU88_005898 [Pleurodeles waltl]